MYSARRVLNTADVYEYRIFFQKQTVFRKRDTAHPSHAQTPLTIELKMGHVSRNDKTRRTDPRAVPLRHVYSQRESYSKNARILNFLCRKLSVLGIELKRSIIRFVNIYNCGRGKKKKKKRTGVYVFFFFSILIT